MNVMLITKIQNRWPLWATLFFVVFASSCELPEQTVGLDIRPESDLLSLYQTDTLQVKMKTVREDSVKTDELSLSLLGNMVSPIFGQTGASIFTQVRLSTNNVNFGNTQYLIIDSLVLVMMMDKEFYGDLVPMRFSIRELGEQLELDSTYYSSRKLAVTGPELILPGSETVLPNPLATTFIDGEEVPASMRFQLSHDLAQRFIDASGTSDMANNDNFISFFKGFQISCNTTQSAILRINLINSQSRLLLYYRQGRGEDPKAFGFNINSETARYCSFEHGYSGSALSGIHLPEGLPGNETGYVQASGSCKLEIEIPNLENLNQYEERAVNQALLIIPVSDLNMPRTAKPERLFVLRKTTDGSFVGIADQSLGIDHADGTFRSTTNDYRLNISRHVQQVLNGTIENTPLYIVTGNASVSVRSVVLNGPDKDIIDNSKNARLLVTFSN